jgi:hypothetical protein
MAGEGIVALVAVDVDDQATVGRDAELRFDGGSTRGHGALKCGMPTTI